MYVEEYIIKRYEDGSTLTVSDIQQVLLKMMKDIDAVCKKHQIPYWLTGGSALGAVRHKGFIPWDDDMDIGMMRKDYERFVEIASKELSDEYVLQCYEKDHRVNVCVPTKVVLKGTHIKEYNSLLRSRCEHWDGLFIDIFICDPISTSKLQDIPRRLLNMILMVLITIVENLHINPVPLKSWFFHNAKRYGELHQDSDMIGYGLTWCFNSLLHPVCYPRDSVFPIKYVPFEDTMLPIPKDPTPMLNVEVSPSHMSLPPKKDRIPKHIKDAKL